MGQLLNVLQYDFAKRAIIAGVLVCLCAAVLGVSLVLKRYSMLGDGLSHVAFGSAAVALAGGFAPLKISIPIVIVAAFLLLRVSENGKIKGDAAIALVSSSALAVGVAVATMTTGMNTDINNYMFGSILALSQTDLVLSVILSVIILLLFALFYNKIFAVTFDENFAAATGVKAKLYNSLLAILTAVTVVIGMRIMGALLISSVITFPAVSAMRINKRYKTVTVLAAVISVLSFLIGITLSFAFDMPAGAAVVIINLLMFIITSAISKIKA